MTQQLSSLMDGELDTHSSEQAIRDCDSPQGKQDWACYHMIGEVLREGRSSRLDVSAAVMAEIDKGPTVLAPRPIQARSKPMQAFGRIALAAAASVVTIGVVGWIGTQGMPGMSSAPVVAKGVTMQIAPNTPGIGQVAEQKVVPAEPSYAAIEVNDYLAAHRQVPSPDQYRAVAARTPATTR